MFADAKFAPRRSELLRSVSNKLEPVKFAWLKFRPANVARLRSRLVKIALVTGLFTNRQMNFGFESMAVFVSNFTWFQIAKSRSAPVRIANVKSAPVRSA